MNKKAKGVSVRWFQASASVVALLLSTTSCSFMFVNSPPSAKEREGGRGRGHSDCTTSRVAPIVDTVIGGYQAFRTGYAATADDSVYEGAPISREADLAFGAGLAALFVSSAVYGYVSTSRCEEWKEGPYRVMGDGEDWEK